MTWFVYVLINPSGVTYTGIALDPDRRLGRHNAGQGARFTRGRGPWRLIHLEGPMDKGSALRREMAVKRDRRLKAGLKSQAIDRCCIAT